MGKQQKEKKSRYVGVMREFILYEHVCECGCFHTQWIYMRLVPVPSMSYTHTHTHTHSSTHSTEDVVSREYTIHLHKRVHGITFKRKAPRAVREIKKFAQQMMGTSDNRISPELNKHLWSQGIRNLPKRLRVQLQR
jgi:ribosomal protein L31E